MALVNVHNLPHCPLSPLIFEKTYMCKQRVAPHLGAWILYQSRVLGQASSDR